MSASTNASSVRYGTVAHQKSAGPKQQRGRVAPVANATASGSTKKVFLNKGPAARSQQTFSASRSQYAQFPSKESDVSCSAVATEAPEATETRVRDDIRNIAIIAHVDHGKTTLVDSMLAQSKVFRENEKVQERVMDSNDLERERGITILSKNTAITYKGTKINVIDTPGHADFGGEVERVLNMIDGVLLLVDSVEGPMPQTRFVLKKALALGKKVLVVVNKVDRPGARPGWVLDTTFDLFCDLGASDEQCDFPVVYASGLNGIAGPEPDELSDDLEPLFDAILSEVSAPEVNTEAPLQMLVTNMDYDEHKGRIGLGRINSGTLVRGQKVSVGIPGEEHRDAKVGELFIYENFGRVPTEEVGAGDICAVSGVQNIGIGETIMGAGAEPLPTIAVEEPTVRMTFLVNTLPFAGQEGKFVTSRNIKDRLDKELEKNLAMRVEPGETADMFIVSGRGTLHITILIENMRREGYEFCVGPPTVIYKEDENGKKLEPYELCVVEVNDEYTGSVISLLNGRKGEMLEMAPSAQGQTTIKYRIPTRGLIGLRNAVLTATRGTGIMNTVFDSYEPFSGEIKMRDNGSLVAHETGEATSYALLSSQERGQMFVKPGDKVYENMVVGIHQRPGDLKVNVCKKKAQTNVRSNKDQTAVLNEPKDMSLDDAVEYIGDDEIVEMTPVSVRVAKNPKMAQKGKGRR